MAEPQHIKILEQGIDTWNQWRNDNPEEPIDLRNADLSGTDLSFADLVDVDCTGADFSGSNLRNANLSTANLSSANLNGCFLGEADLSGANLFAATLHGSYLRNAYMFGADLSDADLSEADLSDTHLRNAHLTKANLLSANLFGANLYAADLGGANLSHADMSICNLVRSNLYGADLNETILRAADLTRANLMRANLFKSNFSGATLTRARLSRAYLGSVDFSHADLRHADLSYTDMTGSNFLETDLRYADASYCDLMKAYISGTQVMGTNFSSAQFTGVCLEDWEIDGDTRLKDVECQYIYLKSKVERPQAGIITRLFEERYPTDSKFKPEEFVRLFQKTMGFVSMVFQNGIDWEAFSQTYQHISEENPTAKMSISSLKNKTNGTIVIKMIVASEVDRSRIHDEFMLSYELLRKALQEEYQVRADQDWIEVVGFSREHIPLRGFINNLFMGINRLSAGHRALNQTREYEKQRQTLIDLAEPRAMHTVLEEATTFQGSMEGDITQGIAEVKLILDNVLGVYTEQTVADRMAGISKAVDLVQNNSDLKASLVSALEDGGSTALEDLLDHPLIHILIDALEQ